MLLDPRFADSNPAEDDVIFKSESVKIRSTTSFGGEVKLSVSCSKILRYVKDPYEFERDTS
jgi:hypothetical protein